MVCIFKKTATSTSIFAKHQQHSQKETDPEEKITKKIKPNPTPGEIPKSNEKQNGKKDESLLKKQKSAEKG